jgi:hypothetical protein
MSIKKNILENFKIGDLVINVSEYDLGFHDIYTILKPKEMAIVIDVDKSKKGWIKLYTESGTIGWYLNWTGYLLLVSKRNE